MLRIENKIILAFHLKILDETMKWLYIKCRSLSIATASLKWNDHKHCQFDMKTHKTPLRRRNMVSAQKQIQDDQLRC